MTINKIYRVEGRILRAVLPTHLTAVHKAIIVAAWCAAVVYKFLVG